VTPLWDSQQALQKHIQPITNTFLNVTNAVCWW